jgi:hypothetical protein
MEGHINEVNEKRDSFLNLESATAKLSAEMQTHLSERHFNAFKMMYIENKTDEQIAKYLGFKTNEKKRSAGYKQIKNLKKIFQARARQIIQDRDIV